MADGITAHAPPRPPRAPSGSKSFCCALSEDCLLIAFAVRLSWASPAPPRTDTDHRDLRLSLLSARAFESTSQRDSSAQDAMLGFAGAVLAMDPSIAADGTVILPLTARAVVEATLPRSCDSATTVCPLRGARRGRRRPRQPRPRRLLPGLLPVTRPQLAQSPLTRSTSPSAQLSLADCQIRAEQRSQVRLRSGATACGASGWLVDLRRARGSSRSRPP